MNMPSRLALAFAALALAVVAQAQETTVLDPVNLQKPPASPVSHAHMTVLAGTYQMEDGRPLRVDGHGLRLRISLGDDESVAMTPSADGVWHSANGELRLQFHDEVGGRPDTVILSMPRRNWSLASVKLR